MYLANSDKTNHSKFFSVRLHWIGLLLKYIAIPDISYFCKKQDSFEIFYNYVIFFTRKHTCMYVCLYNLFKVGNFSKKGRTQSSHLSVSIAKEAQLKRVNIFSHIFCFLVDPFLVSWFLKNTPKITLTMAIYFDKL